MSGKRLTIKQIKLYMDSKLRNKTQMASAARADISVSSARRIERGKITGERKKHTWKTRKDPFEKVWDHFILPLLEKHPNLLPITILEKLQEEFPGEYPDKLLRTLQRRVKKFKILHGPSKEVIFNQEHTPGRVGISDFTKLKGIVVTVNNQEFPHLLYHFRLCYSGWSFLKVVRGGESYTALAEGLQEALWRLGGSPEEHRTDSLSAAFKNKNADACKDSTKNYEEFCKHYNMIPTRNNRGKGHENGSIESPHGHIKRRIEQAFILRGSFDFNDDNEYDAFIDKIATNHNRRNAKEVDFERKYLQKLPKYKTTDFIERVVKVHSSSTVEIKKITYSVPSKLCGETLRAHIYQDRIELYFGAQKIITLKRVYNKKQAKENKVIDYRHLIHSLHKKPQAFRYSQIRDSILPNDKFRFIWKHVDKKMHPRTACKFIVGLLYIAFKYNCEEEVAERVIELIRNKQPLSLVCIERKYKKFETALPELIVEQHLLQDYDNLTRH